MANYVDQDISGLDLTDQNLTGVDFTNANATNVKFTNAIITNAIFKNTLITGANISTLVFSNVQKGHLLLRAANNTIAAVNNLTSLTPAEFRIIQPAVSTETIARISTVTVKIPNSQGEGYTMPVTPVINQLICIFVATNQNIIITTGGTQIRTIRSNGTVVQDVSNGNTTLNYLKIDSISYRLTVGNGNGVIAMIPVDLNVYQVNGSGLGDIVSLNLGSASTTLNMNNNGITNVSSIQGWNVKEVTAGTGVGVTATNGSYAITNSAVVRDVSAGTGITVSTISGVATISNSAVVRDVSAGTGITVSKTGGVATITNSAVVRDVGAGTGITVSKTGGVATITNTGYNWDNNIYSGTLSPAVVNFNPTLPQSLDLNTYSYEVAIDCYMNANPGTWIALGFNEVVNNTSQDANHYAINVGWYGDSNQNKSTYYYHHNTFVNIADDTYIGEKQIRFILEKYIDPKNGVKGVRAVGTYDSFYKTDETTVNAVTANKQFFTKYVVGSPFISTVIDNAQTTYISPITYICLGTNASACITHYRIRTRKYSQVASG